MFLTDFFADFLIWKNSQSFHNCDILFHVLGRIALHFYEEMHPHNFDLFSLNPVVFCVLRETSPAIVPIFIWILHVLSVLFH